MKVRWRRLLNGTQWQTIASHSGSKEGVLPAVVGGRGLSGGLKGIQKMETRCKRHGMAEVHIEKAVGRGGGITN